ncbi:MAG: SelL-related redox protein [Fuerstiella sp.]
MKPKVDSNHSNQPQPWVHLFLRLLAASDLAAAVLLAGFPSFALRLAGIDSNGGSSLLMQCLGLLVGVFGTGYLIAARSPFRNWAVVLLGLFSRLLVGSATILAALGGYLQDLSGWVVAGIALLGAVPLTIMLWQSARFHQSFSERFTLPAPIRKIDPVGRMLSQRGASLTELSRHKPLLVVFLRHSGCTFCREAVADIAEVREQIEQMGTQIAIVHMGQKEPIQLMEQYGLTDLHSFRDPSCSLYDAFGLNLGSFGQLFGPNVLFHTVRAAFAGHRPGAVDGNVFRMPGVFLLNDGDVVRAYRHRSAADRPDYVELAQLSEWQQNDAESAEPTMNTAARGHGSATV